MKLFLALFLLAVAGVVGWYAYCPNPVMDDFQAAVDSGKAESLAPFLDVPALKKNVSDFAKLRYNRADTPSANLTPDQIQAIVDSFVTPDNILLIMKGIPIEPGSAPPAVTDDKTPHPVEKHYETPDVYAIDIYKTQVETPDNKVSLLFERDGWFDWKLAAFRFSWN
jgi:hypothetical protein